MTETAAVPPDVSHPMNLGAQFLGVLFSPRETFASVVARPRWLAMALVLIVLTGGAQMWFQTTTVGRQATLDETVRRTESFGFKVSDPMYEQFRKSIMEPPAWRVGLSAVAMVVVPPIIWAIFAGILFGIFNGAMGGQASFKQVYTVVVYSGVPGVVATLFVTPLNYFRESLSSATNLGVFVPFLPEGSFLARLLGMVDLFLVWWVMVLAIGLAVLYRRKTRSVAVSLFAVYGIIAVAIAAIMALRSTT